MYSDDDVAALYDLLNRQGELDLAVMASNVCRVFVTGEELGVSLTATRAPLAAAGEPHGG